MRVSFSTKILMNLLVACIIIFWVTPLSWVFLTSFNGVASSAFEFPKYLTFEHYMKVANEGRMLTWLWNSTWVALMVASFTSIISIMAAFPFSRLSFRGKGAILWFIILVRIIPFTATILPIYLLSAKLDILNLWGVFIYQTVFAVPFGVLLMKSFYDTIPYEFDESAALEGANMMQIIFNVVAPLSLPGIVVIWFMTFLNSWNDFLFPLIFARDDASHTMSMGLYTAFKDTGAIDYGLLTVLSLVYCVPSIFLYFFVRQKMKTGFAGVGVKG